MLKTKFKVGDRVKCIHEKNYGSEPPEDHVGLITKDLNIHNLHRGERRAFEIDKFRCQMYDDEIVLVKKRRFNLNKILFYSLYLISYPLYKICEFIVDKLED